MRRIFLGCVLALWAGAATASDKLVFAPPAAWVKLAMPPAAPPEDGDDGAPLRRVLSDLQMNLEGPGVDLYVDSILRIQSVQGLSAATVGVQWRPDTDTVTIHSLRILRGGQVIDLLAKGQTFTVLRRETNLERAMLDGMLTATLQPEGLQVGDAVEFSYTKRQRDPTLQGHSEIVAGQLPGPAVDRLRLRALWPKGRPVRWRQTVGLPDAQVTQGAGGTELVVEGTHIERPKPPKGAPPRYGMVATLQLSDFKDWAEVSALMAPLYRKAATLAPDSPIRAEAARIRAESSDPKVQAAAALRLVQDRVRYLFLGMDLGGYLPADADVTWQRRFGDCKAKTAALLALLNELGIEAEPALVSTQAGDGMDERLPMLEMFNHILVRAHVGGQVYWLDGTRTGDRSLDALRIPPWRWALPVTASGAQLEKLVVPPLRMPSVETKVRIDATGGLDAPAPARLEMTLRGDQAMAMRQLLAVAPKADREKFLKTGLGASLPGLEVGTIQDSFDDQAGELKLVVEGSVFMGWDSDPASGARQHTPVSARISGVNLDFKRDPGPGADAPFAVSHPNYTSEVETLILPQGGKGFTVVGEPIDQTVGGIAFKRAGRIENGAALIESSGKSLTDEIPFAQIGEVREALLDLKAATFFIRAPKGYRSGDAERDVRLGRTPTSAAAYMDRAEAWFEVKKPDKAVADYEAAFKMAPDEARSLNGLCFARARAGVKLEEALANCDAALALEARSAAIYDSRGFVNYRLGRLDKALADFDRALKIKPDQPESLYVRGLTRLEKGDKAGGRQDIAAARKLDHKVADTYAGYGVGEGKR